MTTATEENFETIKRMLQSFLPEGYLYEPKAKMIDRMKEKFKKELEQAYNKGIEDGKRAS